MKRLMFYCQHILGIGHLVRSLEIVRGLLQDFEIFFINGGEVVDGFPIPDYAPHDPKGHRVHLINIPAIKTDSEFRELQIPAGFQTVEQVLAHRRDLLLSIFEQVRPHVLIVELFPFGRRRFSAELIPLLEQAKAADTKVVCSLRDIVVTKQDRARHEEKICRLMNQYFDLLLIHGDPQFMPLEVSFSRVQDLNCPVYYTGYVAQTHSSDAAEPTPVLPQPLILTSVGGGRFGHELLDCVAQASQFLQDRIPHQIQMFTGPFCPDDVYASLCDMALQCPNLTVERFTPNLLQYMRQADLSISMAGYNTTMNVLTTGVRSMLLPFAGNDDQEQRLRSERLAELGIVQVIQRQDLEPERFAQKVIACLEQSPASIQFDMQGVEKTAQLVRSIVLEAAVA